MRNFTKKWIVLLLPIFALTAFLQGCATVTFKDNGSKITRTIKHADGTKVQCERDCVWNYRYYPPMRQCLYETCNYAKQSFHKSTKPQNLDVSQKLATILNSNTSSSSRIISVLNGNLEAERDLLTKIESAGLLSMTQLEKDITAKNISIEKLSENPIVIEVAKDLGETPKMVARALRYLSAKAEIIEMQEKGLTLKAPVTPQEI